MSILDKRKKELNEWDYFKEHQKEKRRKEEYIVNSEKKFRIRMLIATAILCIAIIVLGIVYVNNYIKTTNAEAVDNSQAAEIVSTEPLHTEKVYATAVKTSSRNVISETNITAEHKEEISETTTSAVDMSENFFAKAFADKNGLEVKWRYKGNNFEDAKISVYMTDGITEYIPVGTNIPIDTNKISTNENGAKNATGVLIRVTDDNDEVLLEKNIIVENTTYAPEITYPEDVNIGDLFR